MLVVYNTEYNNTLTLVVLVGAVAVISAFSKSLLLFIVPIELLKNVVPLYQFNIIPLCASPSVLDSTLADMTSPALTPST